MPRNTRPSPEAQAEAKAARQQRAKYRRAKIRNFLFTVGPNRLSGGRLLKRHHAGDIRIREIEVASPNWPRAFDGLRIGHVSDFHLGELLPLEKALDVVARLREQEPDIVACTGDVVDLHHTGARPLLDALAGIDAPLGSALVLGNHDELHCAEMLSRIAHEAGLIVLHNQAIEINRNGDHFVLAGIDWAKSAGQCSKYVSEACGSHADLLLSHNPKAFHRAAQLGIPLTLAGHTHGGQVALKTRPNTNLAITHRHSEGVFEQGPSRLFVTTGVGAWFPLRINCPAEIAMITMRHADNGVVASEIEHERAAVRQA
jgi:uncharacterized protein